MPNSGAATGLFDIYGNQFDGEFLGTPTALGGYEDLLPNGQYRNGLTGDGVGGGAFVTGFVVVPNGNVIYARPDATENPLDPSTAPDGSFSKPYSALAPEVNPSQIPANAGPTTRTRARTTPRSSSTSTPTSTATATAASPGRRSTPPSSSRTAARSW